jgi:mRNA interferase HicA
VKKRDLIAAARKVAGARGYGFELLRQGGSHEVWQVAGRRITIPRHREINELTARAILAAVAEAVE